MTFAILADSAYSKKGNAMIFTRLFGLLLVMNTAFATEVVNINTADAAQLSSALAGVGEKKAQQIVTWRKENGHFSSLDDLAKVKGIGPKIVERNKDRIVFSTSGRPSSSSAPAKTHNNELSWPVAPVMP